MSLTPNLADPFSQNFVAFEPLSSNPADLIDTLIRRQRALQNPTAHPAGLDRYPTFSDEQILTAVDVILATQTGKIKIVPSHGTTVACTKCARLTQAHPQPRHHHRLFEVRASERAGVLPEVLAARGAMGRISVWPCV